MVHFWYFLEVTRKSKARGTELLFAAHQSSRPDYILRQMRALPSGGVANDGAIQFEWGNIQSLLKHRLKTSARITRVSPHPSFVYHVDRLPKRRREEVEKTHALPRGSISGSLSDTKADLLILDKSNRPFYISFKEVEGQAKLGQVSGSTSYGRASLDGGIDDLDVNTLPIPAAFDHSHTALSFDSFEKLSAKDQKLAYYKKHFPREWAEYVAARNLDAVHQLKTFCNIVSAHRESFINFVGTTIAGSLKDSDAFFLALGDELIPIKTILTKLKDSSWHVTSSDASTPKKHARVISVCNAKSTYGLMRIEHSFEGAKTRVSQTKGVVYHFQQHPRKGANYKALLHDLR